MFQAGEVDYLVATDAIGMGLNMDVSHVAFAGLTKFDGQRQRRLTVRRDGADRRPRRAAPARRHVRRADRGRAGRVHARGSATRSRSIASRALDFLYWREGEPDLASDRRADRQPRSAARRTACCAPRRRRSISRCSSGSPRRTGCATARARPAMVARLWAACGAARFPQARRSISTRASSARLFEHLSEGDGPYPAPVVRRRDRAARHVSPAMSRRSPGGSRRSRTWAYIAHRADWLADPAHWAARTARGRGAAVRRAPRQPDPALRRQAHHRADAPDRRGCRRAAGGDRRPRAR